MAPSPPTPRPRRKKRDSKKNIKASSSSAPLDGATPTATASTQHPKKLEKNLRVRKGHHAPLRRAPGEGADEAKDAPMKATKGVAGLLY